MSLFRKTRLAPKSHAIDLLNDLVRKRVSTSAPMAWKQLADVLKEQNVPQELIGNDDRWKYIINCSQEEGRAVTATSGGFSYRPGGADRPRRPAPVHWRPHESRHVRPYGLPERNLVLFLIQIDNANGVSAG